MKFCTDTAEQNDAETHTELPAPLHSVDNYART